MRWCVPLILMAMAGWLASCGGGNEALSRWKDASTGEVIAQAPPAEAGYVVFMRRQCNLCHGVRDSGVAPTHHGLWGREVTLSDGQTVVADEAYVRESILYPDRQIVAGFKGGQMANYATILTADEVDVLVAYIESIGGGEGP